MIIPVRLRANMRSRKILRERTSIGQKENGRIDLDRSQKCDGNKTQVNPHAARNQNPELLVDPFA